MKSLSRNKIIAIAAISLGLGFAYALTGSTDRAVKGKRLGVVKRGDLVQRLTMSGMIFPNRRTIFVAPYDGYIRRLYVKIGQKVKINEPVVAITSSLNSPETIYPIRAPFTGTVVDLEKMEGEYVGKEDKKKTIVRIDDLDRFFVIAKAAELDAARVKIGMEVEIKFNAFKHGPITGVVRDIDLAAQEAESWREQQSTFGVKVEVIDPPKEVRSGQSAIVDVVTGKFENVLYLEHEFINHDSSNPKEPYDYVITKRGKKQVVKVGRQSDVAVEILEGLKEGDEVEQIDFLKLLEGA